MAYLESKIAFVIGDGSPEHRAICVALAEAGAGIVVAGPGGDTEVLLHSISNEIWALGRRTTVAAYDTASTPAFAEAVAKATNELGRVDLVVRCESVLQA
jgi:NAD(P)-dependent dehydrogenase (short-subunit alcohol dehydrogenase family)